MHTQNLVTVADANKVRTLTLGAATAHPLSLAMINALQAALQNAADDPDVHVVILSGPGHIFCAGHDLKEISRSRAAPDQGRAFLTDLFNACADMMQRLAGLPKPTIAMVDGIATAAGLQMAASCDMIFASPGATFCLPGVNNGGFCTTPAVAVSRSIGQKHLMELVYSGAPHSAEWALNAGLINRIVATDDLQSETQSFANQLASHNQTAIQSGKAALHAHRDLPLEQAYTLATPVMIDHIMDPARVQIESQGKFKA